MVQTKMNEAASQIWRNKATKQGLSGMEEQHGYDADKNEWIIGLEYQYRYMEQTNKWNKRVSSL